MISFLLKTLMPKPYISMLSASEYNILIAFALSTSCSVQRGPADDVVRVIDNITKFTGGHFPTMYISNFSIWADKITFHFVKWEIIKLEALIYLHPKHFTNSWLAHVGLLHIRYRKYFFRLRVLKLYRHFLYCFFVYQNELFLYSFLFIY